MLVILLALEIGAAAGFEKWDCSASSRRKMVPADQKSSQEYFKEGSSQVLTRVSVSSDQSQTINEFSFSVSFFILLGEICRATLQRVFHLKTNQPTLGLGRKGLRAEGMSKVWGQQREGHFLDAALCQVPHLSQLTVFMVASEDRDYHFCLQTWLRMVRNLPKVTDLLRDIAGSRAQVCPTTSSVSSAQCLKLSW